MQITIREPGSAITHYVAMLLSLFAAAPLLLKAQISNIPFAVLAMGIFILAMVLLYGASATYHAVNATAKVLKNFSKSGSYDDFCPHCRKLYTYLSFSFGQKNRFSAVRPYMGYRIAWNVAGNLLD